jgi:hypothetical protein
VVADHLVQDVPHRGPRLIATDGEATPFHEHTTCQAACPRKAGTSGALPKPVRSFCTWAQIARVQNLEASLRSREAQLADAMKAEQRQWNETSARLDAVERELGARRD